MSYSLVTESDLSQLERLASSKFDEAIRDLIGNYEYTKLVAEGYTQPRQIIARMRKKVAEVKASRTVYPTVLGQDAASQSDV
jgi:hypothetical protein